MLKKLSAAIKSGDRPDRKTVQAKAITKIPKSQKKIRVLRMP